MIPAMRRLGKNHGGYFGETIEVHAVLRDLQAAAQARGWSRELFYQTGGFEMFALRRHWRRSAGPGLSFRRHSRG